MGFRWFSGTKRPFLKGILVLLPPGVANPGFCLLAVSAEVRGIRSRTDTVFLESMASFCLGSLFDRFCSINFSFKVL